MNSLFFVYLIVLFNVIYGTVPQSYEDYFDPVIYYLLNGNETELPGIYNKENDDLNTVLDTGEFFCMIKGGEPVFSEGNWKCGSCENVSESSLIYSETNDVDTNIFDGDFIQVQVGLSFDEMRCITIDSDQDCTVTRVAGDCAGSTVTLIVADSQHFIVRVFG